MAKLFVVLNGIRRAATSVLTERHAEGRVRVVATHSGGGATEETIIH